jgi:hypothetical protein
MTIRETYTLPSGRVVTVAMPDLYAILATVGRVPSQHLVDVLNLLQADGALSTDPDTNRFLVKRNEVRGMYAIAALCLVEPILSLDKEPPEGALTPADLTWADVEAVYWGFFRGWRAPVKREPANPTDADRPTEPPRDGDGLRDEAESDPQD